LRDGEVCRRGLGQGQSRKILCRECLQVETAFSRPDLEFLVLQCKRNLCSLRESAKDIYKLSRSYRYSLGFTGSSDGVRALSATRK
jgi:hypothetical protein